MPLHFNVNCKGTPVVHLWLCFAQSNLNPLLAISKPAENGATTQPPSPAGVDPDNEATTQPPSPAEVEPDARVNKGIVPPTTQPTVGVATTGTRSAPTPQAQVDVETPVQQKVPPADPETTGAKVTETTTSPPHQETTTASVPIVVAKETTSPPETPLPVPVDVAKEATSPPTTAAPQDPGVAPRCPDQAGCEFQGETFPRGSRLKYTCPEGFRIRGRKTMKCKKNGEWGKEPADCKSDERKFYCHLISVA